MRLIIHIRRPHVNPWSTPSCRSKMLGHLHTLRSNRATSTSKPVSNKSRPVAWWPTVRINGPLNKCMRSRNKTSPMPRSHRPIHSNSNKCKSDKCTHNDPVPHMGHHKPVTCNICPSSRTHRKYSEPFVGCGGTRRRAEQIWKSTLKTCYFSHLCFAERMLRILHTQKITHFLTTKGLFIRFGAWNSQPNWGELHFYLFIEWIEKRVGRCGIA